MNRSTEDTFISFFTSSMRYAIQTLVICEASTTLGIDVQQRSMTSKQNAPRVKSDCNNLKLAQSM